MGARGERMGSGSIVRIEKMGWLNWLMLRDLSDVFDHGKSVLMVAVGPEVPSISVVHQATELELELELELRWSWLWLQVSGHETSAVVYLYRHTDWSN